LAAALAAGVDRPRQGRQALGASPVEALAGVAVTVDVALGAALPDPRLVGQTARRASRALVVGSAARRRRGVVTTTGEGEREERGPEAKGAHGRSLPSTGTNGTGKSLTPTRARHLHDTRPNDRQAGLRRSRTHVGRHVRSRQVAARPATFAP
jgi:hypothetical protein